MVLASKVFIVKEEIDIPTISQKLKGFRKEDEFAFGEERYPLVTEIIKLTMGQDSVEGVLSQDYAFTVHHRNGEKVVVKTAESPFAFYRSGGRIFLIVLEKKRAANNIANLLSKILFISVGGIVESRIQPETLKKFHEQNPEDTKVIFFDGVNIPNIEKLSLYGSGLANTLLYTDYSSRGGIWYMVFKSRRYGIVVGVTRNGVVTAFSEIEPPEFVSYIKTEILPLIS